MEQITKNFNFEEFKSKDGAKTPLEAKINIVKLACNLQRLRDYLNKPIIINSGYRSPNHNKNVGGAKNSQHVTGKASDIRVSGISPEKIKEAIEHLILKGDMLQGGIGIYNTFVHYDIRKGKARWDERT